MALENSIVGSIPLITQLTEMSSHYWRTLSGYSHDLMVLKGQKIEDYHRSPHPIALLQSAVFLATIHVNWWKVAILPKQLAEFKKNNLNYAVAAQLPQNYTIWKFCRRNSHGTK
jgi:hypothetical protein